MNKLVKLFFIINIIILSKQCLAINKTLITNAIEPVNYFVNHTTEINKISEQLSNFKKVALVGISGIGKTQLARKYVKNHSNNYKIIWFFDSNLELDEQYASLNKKINLLKLAKIKLSENVKDAKRDLLNFLAVRNDWLLIFDNLKINENNKISDILRWEHNGHIVVCTQSADGLRDVVKLSFLKIEDTKTLVRKLMDYDDDNFISKITDIYQGYPVMIVQVAQYFNNNQHLTVEEYHKMMQNSQDQLKTHLQLILQELSPDGKKILYTMALINNQYFSKELIQELCKSDNEYIKNLQQLITLGIVNTVATQNNFSILEMNDLIKDTILQILSEDNKRQIASDIINNFDELFKGDIQQIRYNLANDPTLFANLEVILNNAELYKIDILKQMALRKTLIMFYTAQSDFANINKMARWLEVQEDTGRIKLNNLNDHYKEIYAWYLIYRALYREFTDGNYEGGIADLNQAKQIVEKYSKNVDLLFNTYANIAQIAIYRGDIVNTETILGKCNKLIAQYPEHKFDMEVYHYFKAMLALEKGDYNVALNAVNKSIQSVEIVNNIVHDTFNFPPYILKMEILNRLGEYSETQMIGSKLIIDAKKLSLQDYEQQCRILTFLAEADLNLGNIKQSEKYIKEAKADLNKIQGRLQQGLSQSIDFDLANAYIVEGKISTEKKDYKMAIGNFKIAEQIYLNRLQNNKKTDKISLLYKCMGKVMDFENSSNGVLEYFNKHKAIFGKNNTRSVEIFKWYLKQTS